MDIKRPIITKELVKKIVEKHPSDDSRFIQDQFAEAFLSRWIPDVFQLDSYLISKVLEEDFDWSFIHFGIVEHINTLCRAINGDYIAIQQNWFKKIKPPFPNGTFLTEGVIRGVSLNYPGYFDVTGLLQEERYPAELVSFENAKELSKEEKMDTLEVLKSIEATQTSSG